MGRRWLYYFYYHKNIEGIFNKYFWYGIFSIIEGKIGFTKNKYKNKMYKFSLFKNITC